MNLLLTHILLRDYDVIDNISERPKKVSGHGRSV